MVISRQLPARVPIEIEYAPQGAHRLLPVEVMNRSALLNRTTGLAHRQRAGFHQLILCTAGQGTHRVDYEAVQLSARTLLRIYPGQVQQFVSERVFEAHMVIWPVESHPADPVAPAWYPGSDAPTRWHLDGDLFPRVSGWIEELRAEQDRFDGSPRHIALMRTLLRSMLLRLAIEFPGSAPDASHLPRPYVDFRELVELRLHDRPTVVTLAQELGYSSRTLDRACMQVSGLTAKQVLAERVALEVRRLLTHTSRPIARVGADFGFGDPSNFSKFVKRHLGRLPREIRDDPAHAATANASP